MPKKFFSYTDSQPKAPIVLKFGEKTFNTTAIIDTGSQRSLCPLPIVVKLGATVEKDRQPLTGICGISCRDGSLTEDALVADVVGAGFRMKLLVPFDAKLPEVILGIRDFFQFHEVVFQKNGFLVSSLDK